MERITIPAISIVIPLYNRGPYISRALNSIINQSFQNFEVIIVDGNSTDNGIEVIRSFNDSRIRLIQQNGKGVSAARNQGVKESQTDFVAFLDADDEWMPSHLETIFRLRKRYPDAGLYTTAYKLFMYDGKIHWANYKYIPSPPWEGLLPNYFTSSALGDYPVWTSVVAIPKKIFNEVGGYPEGYWWGEDADLFGKIALKYPVAFSWEFGGIYHMDAANRTCYKLFLDVEPFVKTARDALNNGEVKSEFIEPLIESIYQKEIWRAEVNVIAGNAIKARAILKQCKPKWVYKMKIKWFILSFVPNPLLLYLMYNYKLISW